MVLVGGRPENQREQREPESETAKARFKMAVAPERSRSLHNFSLPCLKWGGQRQLHCVRFPAAADGASGAGGNRFRAPSKARSVFEAESNDGIEAVRKKLMRHLQSEMDKMKSAVLGNDEIAPPTTTAAWNLRTRRGDEKRQIEVVAEKSPAYGGVKRGRAKLCVALTKRDIEEDFIAMTGIRPPRRPKKRPRTIQKQLDTLFPGLLISEITADMYKVKEDEEARKR